MRVTQFFQTVVVVGIVGAYGVLSIAADPTIHPNSPVMQDPNMPTMPSAAMPALPNGSEGGDRTLLIRTMPSKKLVGADVVNAKGGKVGTIDDVVIDLQTGKVVYAALGVGGVLGIGDKLFAVPYDELRTTHDANNNISFVLDVSKERLENAPGFDKNHWPDFASPQWKSQIETYYHHSTDRSAGEQPLPESR